MAAPTHVPSPLVVDVWLLDVPDDPVSAPGRSLLDAHERARAAGFHHLEDRQRYVAAHVALRERLGARLGVDPGSLRMTRSACPRCGGPHGRPVLVEPPVPVHFSLSSSGDLVLIALASTPVGADVERLAEDATVRAVTPLLHPRERAAVGAAVPAEQPAAFTRIWTRKEAYLKGLGVGVAEDLGADDLTAGASSPVPGGRAPKRPGPPGWQIESLDLHRPYAAAIAAALPRGGSVRLRRHGAG